MVAPHQNQRLTKKQKRTLKQQGVLDKDKNFGPGFAPRTDIKPMTMNQRVAFEAWNRGSNLMLHGIAGTGKTFLAFHFALKSLFNSNRQYKKIYVIRSTVPSRDMGFLPGSTRDKMK